MSANRNQDLWEKSCKVSQGILKLMYACTYFYLYCSVEQALKEYDVEVYLDRYDKFAVRLDDGSEYELIQPCPHLIYDLYNAKKLVESGECTAAIIRKANAYEKFEPFFKRMIGYTKSKHF